MKIFTIENVLPRQRVKRHTGLIKAPRRQQFLANESAHTDHLSVKKTARFSLLRANKKNEKRDDQQIYR